jgi:hypothetical protein
MDKTDMKQIKNIPTDQLHSLLDNYQRILLEENSVLSDSTKLLGNDKITEIINELRKRERENDETN